MADKRVDNGEVYDEQKDSGKDKSKDWAAADLEKVTDCKEEEENGKQVSSEKLDSLMSGPSSHQKETRKTVNIRKEDIHLLMEELELPKIRAERKLIEHNGDVIAAAKDLMGF